MEFIVKGRPMCNAGHASILDLGTSDRYAVGLFGGSGRVEEIDHGTSVERERPLPFPPHTVLMLAEGSA